MEPRLREVIDSFGGGPVPYKATLFEKTGKANWLVAWHQDTFLPVENFGRDREWPAKSVKDGVMFAQAAANILSTITAVRIHLDHSEPDNGPLRVVPGSHRYGILGDDELEKLVRQQEPINCTVGRGGIILMSPLLVHASSKLISDRPRRVLHIEYAHSLVTADGTTLALA